MNSITYNVAFLDKDSALLSSVKALWRKNSSSLGMFPDGAFVEFASKRHIIVAIKNDTLLGYLAFRINKSLRLAVIVHLCIAEQFRGQDIAKALVTFLKAHTLEADLAGISLSCRRDYAANDFWPKLGFIRRGSKPGRGHDAAELIIWRLEHNQDTLWSNIDEVDDKIRVVIDSNIFIDLHDNNVNESESPKYLFADWLKSLVSFYIADELYTEINRSNKTKLDRDRLDTIARKYDELLYEKGLYESLEIEIQKLLPRIKRTPQQESDIRYISKAIAGDADVFLTRDEEIIKHSSIIEEQWGLKIMPPQQLILYLDELERGEVYYPSRLSCSDLQIAKVNDKSIGSIKRVFQAHFAQERSSHFGDILDKLLADCRTVECFVISSNSDPLCLLANSIMNNINVIHILRATKASLALTALRHRILDIISKTAKTGIGGIKIVERHISDAIANMLLELGFINVDGLWYKNTIHFIGSISESLSIINDRSINNIIAKLPNSVSEQFNMEGQFWPLKLSDSEIPTVIVPIKPAWAEHLFDTGIASQNLYPAKTELILNRENIYYSAAIQARPKSPGRILWYVSNEKHIMGIQSIRACSRLLETVVGKPLELYRQFRRLGVYSHKEVLELAKYDKNREIVAMRFCDTELFDAPILYEHTRTVGIKANFQSPVTITSHQFELLYRKGFNL